MSKKGAEVYQHYRASQLGNALQDVLEDMEEVLDTTLQAKILMVFDETVNQHLAQLSDEKVETRKRPLPHVVADIVDFNKSEGLYTMVTREATVKIQDSPDEVDAGFMRVIGVENYVPPPRRRRASAAKPKKKAKKSKKIKGG